MVSVSFTPAKSLDVISSFHSDTTTPIFIFSGWVRFTEILSDKFLPAVAITLHFLSETDKQVSPTLNFPCIFLRY